MFWVLVLGQYNTYDARLSSVLVIMDFIPLLKFNLSYRIVMFHKVCTSDN